jgi:hypothetical protein
MGSVTAPGPGDLGGSALTGGVGASAGEPPLPGGHPRPSARTGEERVEAPLPRAEDDAVQEVLGRLGLVYGSLDGATVELAVREAWEAFRQARIRAFVPILAERRARAVLDAAARRHRSVPEERNPLSV